MTELKEKIINTIKENGVYNGKSMHRDYYVVNDEEQADALIAAGIGDVKEAEMAANRYEMLYKMQSRDMVLAERKVYAAERKVHEAEHRAEVAENELKLYKLAVKIWQERYSDIRCFNFNIALRQAERELAEEEKDDGRGNDEGE